MSHWSLAGHLATQEVLTVLSAFLASLLHDTATTQPVQWLGNAGMGEGERGGGRRGRGSGVGVGGGGWGGIQFVSSYESRL